jgi:hypothetical protein
MLGAEAAGGALRLSERHNEVGAGCYVNGRVTQISRKASLLLSAIAPGVLLLTEAAMRVSYEQPLARARQ